MSNHWSLLLGVLSLSTSLPPCLGFIKNHNDYNLRKRVNQLFLPKQQHAYTQSLSVRSVEEESIPNKNQELGQCRSEYKESLLSYINSFNVIKERDGTVDIDFGVKGGELDSETRAPSLVNYYSVSEALGKASDDIFHAIDNLIHSSSETLDATKFLGTEEGAQCPLHGAWKNIFTNAADAVFSKNSKRGDANVYNVVNGKDGSVWNVIDFKNDTSPLRQLRVRLSACAIGISRVQLVFKYVKVHLRKFLGLNIPMTLTIPVPGPFLTRILYFFQKTKKPPPAYFDILYLDDDLRIHKTAQGAYFVQVRPSWSRI